MIYVLDTHPKIIESSQKDICFPLAKDCVLIIMLGNIQHRTDISQNTNPEKYYKIYHPLKQ